MKKQFFLISTLLVVPGLYAATMDDVFHQLVDAERAIFNEAFGVNHASAMNEWTTAFNNAKKFVIDNSKNLVGQTDSVLVNTMGELGNINQDFVSALNVIKSNLATAPISRLLPIKMNAKKVYDKMYVASFTLSNKKNAKEIIINIARFLEDASRKLYDRLVIKGEMPPKPPVRPLPPIPGR